MYLDNLLHRVGLKSINRNQRCCEALRYDRGIFAFSIAVINIEQINEFVLAFYIRVLQLVH